MYFKLSLTIFTYWLLRLWTKDSEYFQSWIPQFTSVFTVFLVLVFTAWLLSKWSASLILKPFSKLSMEHRAILVTGCDSGIGQKTALSLNQLGFYVFAGCLEPEAPETINSLMVECSSPSRMKILEMDVTNSAQVTNCYDIVCQYLKSENNITELFGLINCAGIMKLGGIEFGQKGEIDDYVDHMEVNAFGTIRVTKTFLSLIRKSKGRIINISSMMSRLATPGSNAYSVSKAALSKFTEGLQVELTPFGVKVIGIEPWLSMTKMTTGKQLLNSIVSRWNSTPKEIRESYGMEYFLKLYRFNSYFSRFPIYVEADKIVDIIVDNMISPEPESVIRIVNPILRFPIFITNDFLAWDFVVMLRQWMFPVIFRLLLQDSFFYSRKK